jgi:hypothetical protein
MNKPCIIAVDFDGTIALGNSFPNLIYSSVNKMLIEWLLYRQKLGDKILLWTCRENYGGKNYPNGTYLNEAIDYCKNFGLIFDSINANYGEIYGECGIAYGRKISADIYIDDKSLPFNHKFWWFILLKLYNLKFLLK